MAFSVSDNSPSAGYIAWTDLIIVRNDVNHNITNGNSNKKYLWWDYDSPTTLQESDTLPDLNDDDGDRIVFLNLSGTHAIVMQATKYRGELIVDNAIEDNHLGELTGWIATQETWTFGADDDPTYTITVSGDQTSKYSAGMRVKLTDSGTQYFIITKVSYSSPNTTITLYGGTDYDLSGGAISSVYYSSMKAPQGFPLDPDKWTVEVTDSTHRSQSSPVKDTWYNLGTLSIDIPLGLWQVEYGATPYITESSSNDKDMFITLSTANNSESDSELTCYLKGWMNNSDVSITVYRKKVLNLASKDTYYFIVRTDDSGINSFEIRNGNSPFIIRAVCAYL